jgi:hypothetical protein
MFVIAQTDIAKLPSWDSEKQDLLTLDDACRIKIQAAVRRIFDQGQKADGITVLRSKEFVFKINDLPGYVIKWDSTSARINEMNAARKICRMLHLNRLYIPKATTIEVQTPKGKETYHVEEELHFVAADSAQERKFQTLGKALEKPIRQLAAFICNSQYVDVEYRNNPILDSLNGKVCIGLVDFEPVGVGDGISGRTDFKRSRGLLNCVSEEHVPCIIDEVKKHRGELLSDETVAEIRSLWNFYRCNNIHHGRENVSVEGIDFSSCFVTEESPKKLVGCVKTIIEAFNVQIQKAPEGYSIKNKRFVKIDYFDFIFSDSDNPSYISHDSFRVVVQELWAKGVIHSIEPSPSRYQFCVQV